MEKENDIIKQTLKEYINILIVSKKKLILENKKLKKELEESEKNYKDLKNSIRHMFK